MPLATSRATNPATSLRQRWPLLTRRVSGGVVFSALLFSLSHAFIVVSRERLPLSSVLSFSLQQACVFALYLRLEASLARRGARFALAALATSYVAYAALDGLLLRITSLPLREIFPMLLASQNVVAGMNEIGLSPFRVGLLGLVLACTAIAGGLLRLFLDEVFFGVAPLSRGGLRAHALVLSVPLLFALEQAHARDGEDYLYRGLRMPAYFQLYSTSSASAVVLLPPPVNHATRASWLAQVPAAKNPKHVLYILLESFRQDVITPEIAPRLHRLAGESIYYENALAEATYTPLSWSVLFFDEAAYDNLFGRHSGRSEPLGAFLFATLRAASYTPRMFVSTNLDYAGTRKRVLGNTPEALDFFQAAARDRSDPIDKNANDRRTVDHAIEFLRSHDLHSASPQLILVQLDSTHYTYPFPPESALYRPYSKPSLVPQPVETSEEARLLRHRYWNAAHFVDMQVGRLLDELSRQGVQDEVAIVVTADHGEGLTLGQLGHAAVNDGTKRVPMLFKLPGKPGARVAALASHRDILPVLGDYLGISFPEGLLQGEVPERRDTGRGHAVLTVSPTGRFGQLTTPSYVLDLRLVFGAHTLTATPSSASRDGRAIPIPSREAWVPLLREFAQRRALGAQDDVALRASTHSHE